jgi:hypothetical protein
MRQYKECLGAELDKYQRCKIHEIKCPFSNVENCATYWRLEAGKRLDDTRLEQKVKELS